MSEPLKPCPTTHDSDPEGLLKRCPFCGGFGAMVNSKKASRVYRYGYFVKCANPRCCVKPRTATVGGTDVAMEQWNRRIAWNTRAAKEGT